MTDRKLKDFLLIIYFAQNHFFTFKSSYLVCAGITI